MITHGTRLKITLCLYRFRHLMSSERLKAGSLADTGKTSVCNSNKRSPQLCSQVRLVSSTLFTDRLFPPADFQQTEHLSSYQLTVPQPIGGRLRRDVDGRPPDQVRWFYYWSVFHFSTCSSGLFHSLVAVWPLTSGNPNSKNKQQTSR